MATLADEVAAIKQSLHLLANHESIPEFAKTWEAIGMEQHLKKDRRDKMIQHLSVLLVEMLEEEKALKKRMEESINSCSLELKQLEQLLQLSNQHDEFNSKTMLEKERLLRERVDALNKIKHDRMKRLKRLTEMEVALCQSLGDKPVISKKWQEQNVPSESDLQNYRKRVEQLESTKDQRQVEFRNIREKACTIWEELETTPTDNLGSVLYQGDVTHFVFSVDNMSKLEKYYNTLESAASEQENEANELREKVISLWERLDIPVEFREDFLSNHHGYKTWVVEELQSEVDRLNILKRDNLEKFITATRVQLHEIWDKCYYGENQRKEFLPAFTDECSDDILSAHESELDRIRGFYADNNEVFKLIEKRELLWEQKKEMDHRANDPARLNNRGGKLLQEQRQHQKVNKELPKTEKKLQNILQQWEDDHSRHFIVNDQRYLDDVESRWDNYHQAKEEEKLKRQQIKAETTVMEMKFGSKPQTPPPKRKAIGPASSNDRASKMRKVGPSPLIKSTASSGKIPGNKTPARKVKTAINPPRKILRERNTPSSASDSFTIHNASLASTGSYNEFQRGLIQGMEYNKTARSSTIPRSSSKLNIN